MNKILVLSMILCLAVCIGSLSADTAEGYSNTFSIDNAAGEPSPVPSSADNPHTQSNGNLLRGQIHAHYYDDGPDLGFLRRPSHRTPAAVATMYRDLGYSFVCLTEHDYVTTAPDVSGIVDAPNCEEVTTLYDFDFQRWDPGIQFAHVLGIGMVENAPGSNIPSRNTTVMPENGKNEIAYPVSNSLQARQQILDAIAARGGIAVIPHPDFISPLEPRFALNPLANFTLGELGSLAGKYAGIALYNAAVRNSAERTWDKLLYDHHVVWGFAEDDYTPGVTGAGKTWIAVPAPAGTVYWDDIKGKMRNGDFYACWMNGSAWPSNRTPPQISVNVTSGEGGRPKIDVTLTGIEDPPSNSTNYLDFIGYKWGFFQSLATYIPHDSTYSYQSTGKEKFVRVLATLHYPFGTLKIASQPIMINKTGFYTPYGSSGLSILSTSPELHLRYLLPSEKPASSPAGGYVGDAFDVTTDSDTCPPGATLDLSYDGENTSAIGGTQYLAIYRYDTVGKLWDKVGGTVDPGTAIITSPITALGYYTISADLPVDTTAPEVFIDNPVTGGVVNADTEVKATVNDHLGAWRVSFYMNGHLLAEDTNALDGWSVNLPIADYCTGDWTLKAVAEDLAGNRGEAEIPIYINSTTPRPTVTITSPTGGEDLMGTRIATGTCGDDIAVAAVTLYADDALVGFGLFDGSGGWSAEIDTTYLADGARTLRAVVEDYPGNEAEATVSVNLSNGSFPLGILREIEDGRTVRVQPAIVTAGTAEIGGAFYIEAADRSTGIRVVTDKVVPEGAQVSVAGVLGRSNGERQITASDVFVETTGNPLPRPLGTIGSSFKAGLESTGLLVKLWGWVMQVGDGYIYVDDGSHVWDGTYTGTDKNYGVRVVCDDGNRYEHCDLAVTGISSNFTDADGPVAPRIITRRGEDIETIECMIIIDPPLL